MKSHTCNWLAIFVLLIISLILPSCPGSSHYNVDSVSGRIYYLDTSSTGIDVLVDCDKKNTDSENFINVIGLSAALSYTKNIGTREPGILGVLDSVLYVKVYKVTNSNAIELNLEYLPLDKYLLKNCNYEDAPNERSGNSDLHYKGHESKFYENVFEGEETFNNYRDVLNTNNYLTQMNHYYLISEDILETDSIQVKIYKNKLD